MPPKKKVTADGEVAEGGPFKWEAPPPHPRPLRQASEYDQLTQAFSGTSFSSNHSSLLSNTHTGTTIGSIRNRISALRVKQRDAYKDLGWEVPEGAAGYSNKKAAGTPKKTPAKKRGAEESGEDLEETPVKKPRAKKAKKEDVKKASDEDPIEEAGGVKEEVLENEF